MQKEKGERFFSEIIYGNSIQYFLLKTAKISKNNVLGSN